MDVPAGSQKVIVLSKKGDRNVSFFVLQQFTIIN